MRDAAHSLLIALIAFCSAPSGASAGPALLMEPSSGLVLYAEDLDTPWRPASLTKLMTAYIAFEAIRDGKLSPDDLLVCSQHAQSQPPSKLGLAVGGTLKVDLGIKALIVKSANDVAVMIAEKIGGTEANFVDIMNETAKRLGMTNTKFVNPNGLPMFNPDGSEAPDQSVTSARDMAILASAILNEFPRYAPIFAMTEVKIGAKMIHTHNSLLKSYDGADGMKTGFICGSGYNLVASATRDGRQLVAVVLGENSGAARTIRAAGLFEHGFQIYAWKAALAPTIATWPVETPEGAKAPDLHDTVCNFRRVSRTVKNRRPQLAPGHRVLKTAKKSGVNT
jgi:D-alanyl-D-alanine carboxypeptidase